jgi:hypothetical protein
MSATDEREVVLAFVRGERGWQDLALAGVSVSFMDDGCDCEGAGTVVVRPSVADIATGFTTHMSSREVDLRRWASVILAASTIIDLEALEQDQDGEQILSALWDASAGLTLDTGTEMLLRSNTGPGGPKGS